MGQTHDMPLDIMDVAGLLHIRIRRPSGRGYYADCPFCGDKRGKLHLNTEFDGWKCNYCGEHGGMLDLFGKLKGISRSESYREICDALQNRRNNLLVPMRKRWIKLSVRCFPC